MQLYQSDYDSDASSDHSSRSSSYNQSAAEILLGLSVERLAEAGTDSPNIWKDDPSARERYLEVEAQRPESLVSRILSQRKWWSDSDASDVQGVSDDGDSTTGTFYLQGSPLKRKRSHDEEPLCHGHENDVLPLAESKEPQTKKFKLDEPEPPVDTVPSMHDGRKSSVNSLLPETLFAQVESLLRNGRLAKAEALLNKATYDFAHASASAEDQNRNADRPTALSASMSRFCVHVSDQIWRGNSALCEGRVIDPRLVVSYFDELTPVLFDEYSSFTSTEDGRGGSSVECGVADYIEVWDGAREYMPQEMSMDDKDISVTRLGFEIRGLENGGLEVG
ncbi:hypothetical protein BU15DRAFT_68670 [Melanogaster broomeanus]|nr:hypothetical protein BU15DRAFT_68670 [Melanogaster broomeanus]